MFQEHAGRDKAFAVVVETVDLDLGGKVLRRIPGFYVEAQKVAEGVAVLPRVQPPEHRVSAAVSQRGTRVGDFRREVGDGLLALRFAGLTFVFGWHVAQIQLVDNLLVLFERIQGGDGVRERVETSIGLLLFAPVAGDAICFQKGGCRPGFGRWSVLRCQCSSDEEDATHGRGRKLS